MDPRSRRIAVLAVVAAVAVVVVIVLPAGDSADEGASAVTSPFPVDGTPVPARRPDARATSTAPAAGEARATQLGTPSPRRYRPGGPERAAAEYLSAWHARAWDRMALWTGAAFRARRADPGDELRRRFGAFRLTGWTVRRERLRPGKGGARLSVLVAYRGQRPVVRRAELHLFLVRIGGRWGVVQGAGDVIRPGLRPG